MQITMTPVKEVRPDHSLMPMKQFKLFLLCRREDTNACTQTLTAAGYRVFSIRHYHPYPLGEREKSLEASYLDMTECNGVATYDNWKWSADACELSDLAEHDESNLRFKHVGWWLMKAAQQ